MARQQQQQQDKMKTFKTIVLINDQSLGIGAYGAVCKAKCDDLLCAAKIIHPTLFDPTALDEVAPHREHRLPIRRFEQECEFLSTVQHPNIVQYLGTHQDPNTGLPVLLMELMDDSLTHFLEKSPQPIPYHIQVNVCYDITLALSFLHSNGIIHRDLSSNNVLLIGNVRAKVTDFGMAKLHDKNQQVTQCTFTVCPGTDVYMPPEAVKDKPTYTEKIDCFSFGVIAVQIVTRQFPKPGDRRNEIQINQPGLPPIVEVAVSEVERRQNHIDVIDPNHPLKQVALDCLKDRDFERPSAQQLCERVAALKEDPQYTESVRVVQARSSAEQDRNDKRDRELRSLRHQHRQQIRGLQQIIQSQTSRLEEKDQTIAQKDEVITRNNETVAELREQTRQLEREKGVIFEEKERELKQKMDENNRLERHLKCVNQQLEESEQLNALLQKRIAELEQLRSVTGSSSSSKEQRASIKLTWREGEKAPCKMRNSHCTAMDGTTLYVKVGHEMHCYTIDTSSWSQLPNSICDSCPSVIINNLLTLVGGLLGSTPTNQLFSLTGEGSSRRWTEEFPPMPTERYGATALYTGTTLIVAGGIMNSWYGCRLQTVEMLNTETLQWSTAADLPKPLYEAPAAVCGDQVYILGKSNMYTCSILAHLESCKSYSPTSRNKDTRVWKDVAAPPVTETTCVSIHGQLLAVGGWGSDKKPTAALHSYSPTTDSWEVISHMGTPRRNCIAAVLPNNQLMMVGGYTGQSGFVETDSVEFASVV